MAKEFNPDQLKERNPITYQAHKRQSTWQIFVPLGLGVLLVLMVAICATQGSNFQVSQWADASLVLMISSWMLVGLLSLAVVVVSVYGLSRVLRILPYYFFRSQGFLFRLQLRSHTINNAAVEPILRIQILSAKASAIKRQFRLPKRK